MSIAKFLCVRRLFQKSYNPKTLFYEAYKTARLNNLDMSVLPISIQRMSYDLDNQILLCDEDFNDIVASEKLSHWDWTSIKRLPIALFLALMHLKEIPDWLDETMLVESNYYHKELINIRDPYDTDELNEWNNLRKPFKTMWKICKNCYLNCEDPDQYRFIYNKCIFIEDAELIMSRLQDGSSWCEMCHTTPLFALSVVYENSPNRKRLCYDSSDDDDYITESFFVTHPNNRH